MGKKEFKRFESLMFLMLEVLDRAVKMKELQLEEKKLNIDRELWIEKRSGNKVGSNLSGVKLYDKNDFVISHKNAGEFVVTKNDFLRIKNAKSLEDVKSIPVPDFVLKDLFPEQFKSEEENKMREEWISSGEKISQFIFADYGGKNCCCQVCVAEKNLKSNGQT